MRSLYKIDHSFREFYFGAIFSDDPLGADCIPGGVSTWAMARLRDSWPLKLTASPQKGNPTPESFIRKPYHSWSMKVAAPSITVSPSCMAQ
jgi:hypothetical protein